MKRFFKKKWHGIPIGIVASILVGTAVLAAILIGVTQTITQEITEPYVPPPPDYGSITAGPLTLDSVEAGKNVSQSFPGAVTVLVGPDGVGKYLHLKLNSTTDLQFRRTLH